MLNSKAETLRTGWTRKMGVRNELFEDESLVVMIYKDETLLWVCSSRTC